MNETSYGLEVAFNDLDLKRIERTVGSLCTRRSPVQFKDKLQCKYRINGQAVVVYEWRPYWKSPQEWIAHDVAKLRFIRKQGEWQLYWMRADLKWHAYKPRHRSKDLAKLVEEIDRDPFGAFFG